jgi:hypothetical protein
LHTSSYGHGMDANNEVLGRTFVRCRQASEKLATTSPLPTPRRWRPDWQLWRTGGTASPRKRSSGPPPAAMDARTARNAPSDGQGARGSTCGTRELLSFSSCQSALHRIGPVGANFETAASAASLFRSGSRGHWPIAWPCQNALIADPFWAAQNWRQVRRDEWDFRPRYNCNQLDRPNLQP